MKCNEMLSETIIHCGLWVWFQCYTGEGVKIHRKNGLLKRTESQEEIQTS